MTSLRAFAILSTLLAVIAGRIEAKPRTCRIVFPERPKDAPHRAVLYDGSRNHAVTLPSMNFSEVIELPDGEVTIALTPREIKEPEELAPTAPRLKIPGTVKDFYIILLSDPDNKEMPVNMNLVDAGAGKLNQGETLWYNSTDHRILATLGNARISLAPKENSISKAPAPASGYYDALFTYEADGKGPPVPITEQRWWHDPGCRHLGFVANSGGKLPKIYLYRDFREPEPADKPDAEDFQL